MRPDTSGDARNEVTNMKDMESVYDANALLDAFRQAKKGTAWKESVQRYEMNLLRNINHTQKELANGTYEQKDFYEFSLSERGKTRHIKSMHISDRVVQRSVCDNVLIPELQRYLIYDNGASMEGKGIHFARKSTHLHRYYRKHKSNEGYILLIDFSKFFDNINHEPLIEAMRNKIGDTETMSFVEKLIDTFKIDVSYMTDEEYKESLNTLYNALEYAKIDEEELTGQKFMKKSVGIGSQISQISGVFYPTRIDNYCKIVKGMKYYGRYMDDFYLIHENREYLKYCMEEIRKKCKEYGFVLNEKKTKIAPLRKGVKFLKTKFFLNETGAVIRKMNRKSPVKMRKKLRIFRRWIDEGRFTITDVETAYQSWRGHMIRGNSTLVLRKMDAFYNSLFKNKEDSGHGKVSEERQLARAC